MLKEKYKDLDIEIITFNACDVIVTSNDDEEEGGIGKG